MLGKELLSLTSDWAAYNRYTNLFIYQDIRTILCYIQQKTFGETENCDLSLPLKRTHN